MGGVSASPGPGWSRTGDQAERKAAAGRALPARLRQGVAVRGRSGRVPLAPLVCVGPGVLRPAAGAGAFSSPGTPGVGREVAEDHLRHVATPRILRRAVPPRDDGAAAAAAAADKNRLIWTRESLGGGFAPPTGPGSPATASGPTRCGCSSG